MKNAPTFLSHNNLATVSVHSIFSVQFSSLMVYWYLVIFNDFLKALFNLDFIAGSCRNKTSIEFNHYHVVKVGLCDFLHWPFRSTFVKIKEWPKKTELFQFWFIFWRFFLKVFLQLQSRVIGKQSKKTDEKGRVGAGV